MNVISKITESHEGDPTLKYSGVVSTLSLNLTHHNAILLVHLILSETPKPRLYQETFFALR